MLIEFSVCLGIDVRLSTNVCLNISTRLRISVRLNINVRMSRHLCLKLGIDNADVGILVYLSKKEKPLSNFQLPKHEDYILIQRNTIMYK